MGNLRPHRRKGGSHDWRVIISYALTDTQAAAMTFGPTNGEATTVQITNDMIADASQVACWKCDRTYADANEEPCKPKGAVG